MLKVKLIGSRLNSGAKICKKNKYIFICIFLYFIYSCSVEKNKVEINVVYNPNAELILEDTLAFLNTDSIYIGLVRDIEVIKDKIYISDRSNCKILVFDQNLKYIKSSPGYGHGPGEFVTPQYLCKNKDHLVVNGPNRNALLYLDSNFFIIKTIIPPPEYITNFANQPVFNGARVFASAYNKFPGNRNKLGNITTALLFDTHNSFKKAICNFDKVYDNNINIAYYQNMLYSFVSRGFNDTYFVIQLATHKYNQYDKNGNYIKTLNYEPRFFISPPQISVTKARSYSRKKYYEEFITKSMYYQNLLFDEKNNLLYMNYCRMKNDVLYTKSFSDIDSYLIVFNSKNECIFDQPIEGYMAAVEDGYIYTVIKEEEEFLMNKYIVKLK